ncbi:MAG TPA: hypothetical protein VL282_05985, partial [Tepidisphaeraceae bacterium]|nr:hypothetical protein [Tepidisphaeraceae bacterium]
LVSVILLVLFLVGATSIGVKPLTELTGTYKNQDGGLYGHGNNTPPSAHRTAAATAASRIIPRNAQGAASSTGKIVLLSIGMSNTTQEYQRFIQVANSDMSKSPSVLLVDGAQGGRDALDWSSTTTSVGQQVWSTVDQRLAAAGVTRQQVQAVWLKQARKDPAALGAFPAHAQALATNLISIVQIAKSRFPNLQIIYFSSRIYGGYATTNLNPEPYAYESCFAVRHVIQSQINGDASLNYDPSKGAVKAPVLLWGAYLWADGLKPRADGLIWKREDFVSDGTHPSDTGRQKVADLLLKFFKNDPTAKVWFVKH